MSEKYHQVNFDSEGHALAGSHHDEAMQSAIEDQIAQHPAGEVAFQSVIDQESLNGNYAHQIADINTYFNSRGLPISPVVIVSRGTMAKAYREAGEHPPEDVESAEGRSVHGRAVIIENPEFQEIFGDDYLLGIGLHEAAHSTGVDNIITTTRETILSDENGRRSIRTVLGGVASGGFIKADLRRNTPNKPVGDFWEEAFADLTRVRGMRFLGRGHDITNKSKILDPVDGVNITVVSNNSVKDQANIEGTTIVPAEFAASVTTSTEGRDIVGFSAPNLAAYALEILNSIAPGLYDDMEAGRHNPLKQAEAIRKIDNLKPGLYRQLRDLDYNTPDFAFGLATIVEAISPLLVRK